MEKAKKNKRVKKKDISSNDITNKNEKKPIDGNKDVNENLIQNNSIDNSKIYKILISEIPDVKDFDFVLENIYLNFLKGFLNEKFIISENISMLNDYFSNNTNFSKSEKDDIINKFKDYVENYFNCADRKKKIDLIIKQLKQIIKEINRFIQVNTLKVDKKSTNLKIETNYENNNYDLNKSALLKINKLTSLINSKHKYTTNIATNIEKIVNKLFKNNNTFNRQINESSVENEENKISNDILIKIKDKNTSSNTDNMYNSSNIIKLYFDSQKLDDTETIDNSNIIKEFDTSINVLVKNNVNLIDDIKTEKAKVFELKCFLDNCNKSCYFTNNNYIDFDFSNI